MTNPITRAADTHLVLSELQRAKPKPTKEAKVKHKSKIDKEDILSRRESWLCDCGCGKPGHDLHHALIGRHGGVRELDDERNLVLVNHDEHISRKFDNQEWRKKFWLIQCDRYGYRSMLEWMSKVPVNFENRMDWL